AEPGGFGRFLEVHAENELVLVDGAPRALLVVAVQAAGNEIGGRREIHEPLGGRVDAGRGNGVVGERRGGDRAIGVLDASGGIVNHVGNTAEVAALHVGGGHGKGGLHLAALAE